MGGGGCEFENNCFDEDKERGEYKTELERRTKEDLIILVSTLRQQNLDFMGPTIVGAMHFPEMHQAIKNKDFNKLAYYVDLYMNQYEDTLKHIYIRTGEDRKREEDKTLFEKTYNETLATAVVEAYRIYKRLRKRWKNRT